MKIVDFLERYVEGYLFEDLNAMAPLTLPQGKKYGAVGYPMVAATLAGIELLGALTSQDTFDRRSGRTYFCGFWKRCYPADHRRELGDAMYALLRNGVAHVFVSKPRITVYKSDDPRFHLHRDPLSGALVVNALTLAEDLKEAYWREVKPVASSDSVMQQRLREILKESSQQSDIYADAIALAPLINLTTQVGGVVVFETSNVSTTSPGSFSAGPTPVNSPAPPISKKS